MTRFLKPITDWWSWCWSMRHFRTAEKAAIKRGNTRAIGNIRKARRAYVHAGLGWRA